MGSQIEQVLPSNNKLALDCTVLANNKTYQAWTRTGLALFASGLGPAKFLKKEISLWTILVRASVLLLLSALAFIQDGWLYSHINIKFSSLDIGNRPAWQIWIVSILLSLTSLFALLGLLSDVFLVGK